MTHVVERLYNDFINASDAAAQNHQARGRVLEIEKQLCTELAKEKGTIVIRNLRFQLSVVLVGGVRYEYFRVLTERAAADTDVEYRFPRRTEVPDVISVPDPWRDPRRRIGD